MDKEVGCSNSRNTIKTDLSLLLECLKFQMKCPDLQKQALLAIHSICEKREDVVEMLREMGGVAFIFNLSKSSIVHSDVKETALFTLCTLAEASVFCKNSLCRKETFAQLAGLLMTEDIPLKQKRVSVYLLSVLVVHNKSGQTLAQTTGCLDILLDLFRTTFPLCTEATMRAANTAQTYQLWASVSSALCGCVNNPQNEEGQRICGAVFPIIKIWLQQITLPRTEIFQPICSFIAMTVANNSCVQESFSASGGLDMLCLALVNNATSAHTSLLSCQLSVTISKTLSACITASLASGLALYGVVSSLFSVFTSQHLESEDRLSILLTLGNCTEASEEHQSQLVQCGGLPLIITLITEDTSEEVRKVATFILQNCKQATMSFGVPGLTARQGESEIVQPLTNMESFKGSARELLHRLDLLEKGQPEEDKDEHRAADLSASSERPGQLYVEAGSDNIKVQTVKNIIKKENDNELRNMSSKLGMHEEKAKTSGGDVWCAVCQGTAILMSSHQQSLEGGREPHNADNQFFKLPAPVRHNVPKKVSCPEKRLQGHHGFTKLEKNPTEEHLLSPVRCAGCALSFEEVTSRTFMSVQSLCHPSCDMHKILQEATQRFRTCHWDILLKRESQNPTVEQTELNSRTASTARPKRSWETSNKVCLIPINRGSGKGKNSLEEHHWKRQTGFTVTPLHRGVKKDRMTSYPKAAKEEERLQP